MHVISQDEWAMPPLDDDHDTRELEVVVEANIHHDAMERPKRHSDCADRVRAIDRAHRERGYAGIGYTRVLCPHGDVFKCRPRRVVPAAAFGHNTPIIAYCIMANENEFANTAQFQALTEMVRRDEEAVGHKLKWTTHKEVCPPGYTECPGMGIQSQVNQYRKKR